MNVSTLCKILATAGMVTLCPASVLGSVLYQYHGQILTRKGGTWIGYIDQGQHDIYPTNASITVTFQTDQLLDLYLAKRRGDIFLWSDGKPVSDGTNNAKISTFSMSDGLHTFSSSQIDGFLLRFDYSNFGSVPYAWYISVEVNWTDSDYANANIAYPFASYGKSDFTHTTLGKYNGWDRLAVNPGYWTVTDYGSGAPGGSVPEPATLCLIGIGGIIVANVYSRKAIAGRTDQRREVI